METPMNAIANAPIYDADAVDTLLDMSFNKVVLARFGCPPARRDGFVTFFDPGWSIWKLLDLVEIKRCFFRQQTWYDRQQFAGLEERPDYRQLRMDAVPDSFGKTFAEQQTLVPAGEEISTARVVVMAAAIHFFATGSRLFTDYFVRCVDEPSSTRRVIVGAFDAAGIQILDRGANFATGRIGIVLARKL